jgi:hypothetical protein
MGRNSALAGLRCPLRPPNPQRMGAALTDAANRRAALDGVIEADPVAACVRAMMAERRQWSGTASDFLLVAARLQRDEVSM